VAPFRIRGSDVSVIYDLMIHDLDLLRYLCGAEIQELSASGQTLLSQDFDAVQSFLTLDSGTKAFIHVNRAAPSIQRSIKVVFSDEVVFLNTQSHEIQRSFPVSPEAPEPMKFESVQMDKSDALADELDHFIRVVRGEISPLITAEDGLRALRDCEKMADILGKNHS
jgi:predicted dehydrogenase